MSNIKPFEYYLHNGLDTDLYYKQFSKNFTSLEVGKLYYQQAYNKDGNVWKVITIHDGIAFCSSLTSGHGLFYANGASAGWCYRDGRENYRLSKLAQ